MNATRSWRGQNYRHVSVYYDRDGIRITNEHIVVGGDVYPVTHVQSVWLQRRPLSGGGLLLAAIAPTAVLAALIASRGTPNYLTGVLLAGVVSVVALVAVVAVRLWPRSYEVWIDYDGVPTKALATGEEWRANQFARVVHRVIVARARAEI